MNDKQQIKLLKQQRRVMLRIIKKLVKIVKRAAKYSMSDRIESQVLSDVDVIEAEIAECEKLI